MDKKFWEKKHKNHHRYAHQDSKDPEWLRHEKHILALTWSGRPIYTRYGDESKLASYMGVVSAIISNYERMGDKIRSIVAGEHKFVFVVKGPIYLIAISRTPECVSQLRVQLDHVYLQILSILTGSINRHLEAQPGTDVHAMMTGAENLLTDAINAADRLPSYVLDAVSTVRMSRTLRARVASALRKGKAKGLLYTILLAGTHLVAVEKAKDFVLHTSDLLLLINFVTNSQSLRSQESFTPICLPRLFETSFVHAYVCYLTADVGLILIDTSAQEFLSLRACKQTILEALLKRNCVEEVERAFHNSIYHVDDLDLPADLRHFWYKSESLAQHTQPTPGAPYNTKKAQKQLFRRYQRLHSRMQNGVTGKRNMLYCEVDDSAAMMACTRVGECVLYATFMPLASKEVMTITCQRIMRWAKREESHLFVM